MVKMVKKLSAIFFTIVLFGNICICNIALAQEKIFSSGEAEEEGILENRYLDLGKISITPYRTKVNYSLNPASIDVINVYEKNQEGILSMMDAIKDIPSLSYSTTGGIGGITGVNIRGADSDHTQVLLDGIQIYDPVVTSRYFFGYKYMSLDNLERIEVLKGPYGALYGSDSIGGTINLLTHKGKGKPSFSFDQEIGSYQTFKERFSSQGSLGKFAYSLSISKSDVNSFYSSSYKNGNYERDPFHNFNSSLRLDYEIIKGMEIGLLTNYTYAKYEFDGDSGWPNYTPADSNTKFSNYNQGVCGINLNHKITDDLKHKLILGYTRIYRKSKTTETQDSWFNGKTYQLRWQGDYQIITPYKIILGFDYFRDLGESRSFDPIWGNSFSPKQTSNTKGYYVENIFSPLENLFFAASYRFEDHSVFNHHNTYSVSGSYTIKKTNTKIKGSFGEGFKSPSLYQLLDDQYGNTNLEPEESESYEIGFEQKLSDSFRFGSLYFHTHIKNIIEWTYPAGYINSSKTRIYGIESFFEYLLNNNTTLTISYTHTDTKKLSDGTRLLRRPNNKITFKLKTSFDKLDIHADLSYVGNRMDRSSSKLKSYILGNIALNYKVNEKLDTFLRFENILDEDYELINDYQTPKFSVYTGVRVKF